MFKDHFQAKVNESLIKNKIIDEFIAIINLNTETAAYSMTGKHVFGDHFITKLKHVKALLQLRLEPVQSLNMYYLP